MTARREFLRLAGLSALCASGATGCAEKPSTSRWNDGRLFIATGNTTGVFYQWGGGYADIISRYLPGYQARAELTGGSGENIKRVSSGDMDLGLTFTDTAADAVKGERSFADSPQNIQAIARIYRNFTHLVVRRSTGIRTTADLRGKRVSTGTPNSGTDNLATRIMTAAGLDPGRDIERFQISLPETTQRMKAKTLDAFFFSGGPPALGVTEILSADRQEFRLIPTDDVMKPLVAAFGPAYQTVPISAKVYDTPSDVPTITVNNLLIVNPALPADLVYDLTSVLFQHKAELTKAHPAGADLNPATGDETQPISLHPGAARYYAERP